MQKILAVDRLPETVVVLDEGRDEFMQAGLNRDKFNGPLGRVDGFDQDEAADEGEE
jgi:hypothetical protein